ncbi:DUF6449 domain-containing protein [Halalkalibacter alkalisediminis]|uniref:DUF6449 domain-containing protein n=1 Tax=Halalkalibacter alkalisediminis TaxID=935616 RepID=A0ABV6NLP6_9BACI|nr:DUF6449 domain-containing protein [Halalkalibacter alkalisediminis]
MRLKTLLFNKGIFIQNIRHVGWIGLGYLVCLLFAMPLQLLLAYTNEDHYRYHQIPDQLIGLSKDFQVILTFVFPVLLAIFLFRYIQVKLSSDFTHSLPIKRGLLFNQHLLFGLLVFILPVFVVAAILLGLGSFLPYEELLSFSSILSWAGTTTLFNVFVFVSGVFVGMFTGMSVLQGALTYILFVFPVGVVVLFSANLDFYLFGFTSNYYLTQKLETVIPFVRLMELERVPFTISEILIYVGLIIAFYLAALLAYQKRHVETATQAIAFPALRPVFKYGVTFCTMLVGGLYFGDMHGANGWIIFGYVTASILGYVLSMMILEKTWRVFAKWKGYVVYMVVVTILGLAFQIDMFGYEKNIPSVEDVQGIYFGDSLYQFNEEEFADYPDVDRPIEYVKQSFYYEDKELIEKINSLHAQIIKEKNQLQASSEPGNSIALQYELKDGSKLARQYSIPIQTYQKLYRDIIESEEYMQNQNPVLKLGDEDIAHLDRITIYAFKNGDRVILTDREDIEEFHQWLQADVENESLETFLDKRFWWSDIEYEWPDRKTLRVSWKKSYTQIEAWLDKRGLLAQARFTADDFTHAYVIKNPDKRELYTFVRENDLEATFADRPDAIKLEAADEIDEILKQASTSHDRGDYIIGFYSEEVPYPEFQILLQEHVPDFIKKELP